MEHKMAQVTAEEGNASANNDNSNHNATSGIRAYASDVSDVSMAGYYSSQQEQQQQEHQQQQAAGDDDDTDTKSTSTSTPAFPDYSRHSDATFPTSNAAHAQSSLSQKTMDQQTTDDAESEPSPPMYLIHNIKKKNYVRNYGNSNNNNNNNNPLLLYRAPNSPTAFLSIETTRN
jgi:hypothetical protein